MKIFRNTANRLCVGENRDKLSVLLQAIYLNRRLTKMSVKGIGLESQVEVEYLEQGQEQARLSGIKIVRVAPPEDIPVGLGLDSRIEIDLAAEALRGEAWQQQQGDSARLVSALHYSRAEMRPRGIENVQGGVLGEGMTGAHRLETSADPAAVKDDGETAAARNSSNPAEYVSRVIDRLVELRRELTDAGNQVPRELKA